MLVPQHKRQSEWPAPLSIDTELDELLNIYVKEIYSQFTQPRAATVFLRNDGSSFHEGAISKRLPEFWRKSSIRSDLRVTATNRRKWIVTTCNQKKRQGLKVDEEVLRRAMCHSDRVEKKCYLREDMTVTAAQAMDIIAMCTSGKESDPSPTRHVSSEIVKPSDPSPACHVSSEMVKPSLTVPFESLLEPPSLGQSTECREKPSAYAHKPTSSNESSDERRLTDRENELIECVFENVIKSTEKVETKEVKKHMKTEVKMRILLTSDKMVKKVVDRVRYLQYKTQKMLETSPDDLPASEIEEQTQAWVNSAESSTSQSSCRMEWSQQDNEVILKQFGRLDKVPRKKDLIDDFNTIEDLIPFLKTHGLQRCLDKVKNTVNKLKKKSC